MGSQPGRNGPRESDSHALGRDPDCRAAVVEEDDWPYLWIGATYVKTREAGRIVSVTVGVSTSGQREVLRLKVGASEAEPFWTEFLRSLNRRGLRGVKLVISDSHEGIKAAAAKVLKATWQRCRVHFMRNALAHAGKTCTPCGGPLGTLGRSSGGAARRTRHKSGTRAGRATDYDGKNRRKSLT